MTDDGRGALRVVVVEDTGVTRAGLAWALGEAGHDVTVTDGVPALRARVAAGDVDVVVFDLYLHGSGAGPSLDALEELTTAGHRVVVYSTWALDPDINAALDLGAAAYLQKGSAVEPLVQAVERVAALADGDPPLMTPEVAAAARRRQRFGLTPAEVEVLTYVSQHLTNAEIAALRYVSEDTIKTQLGSIRSKLGAASRGEAVREARRHGLLGRWVPEQA